VGQDGTTLTTTLLLLMIVRVIAGRIGAVAWALAEGSEGRGLEPWEGDACR
jgi:hypothetical protein